MRSDSALLSLIEHFPVSASLKEADTGRYIVNNAYNARQFGVADPSQLVGLTIHDLGARRSDWGMRYAHTIEKLDFSARDKKTHVLGRHGFLDDSGEAQLEEMVKFPVLGARGNILGIVTYRHDITQSLPPNSLYRLQLHFHDTQIAIKRTLSYLKIAQCFIALPTDAQLRVFLLKVERFSNKEVGKFLGMSDRTVECHFSALRNKVVDGNLAHVLSLIKWNSPCVCIPIHY